MVTAMSPPGRPTLDPALDARLVARCLAGEARAWDALVRRHERLVYAIGRSYRLADEDLGDLFQDVFAALHRGLPRLRDGRTLCRWLSSTSDRMARTLALRRRREQALSAPAHEITDILADPGPSPAAELEALEAQQRVRMALAGLAPRCQKLLHALYYEDPTPAYAELSRRLGVPIGSLGPTRARCMDRLRAGLGSEDSATGRISTDVPPTSPSEDDPVRGAPVPAAGAPREAGSPYPVRRHE